MTILYSIKSDIATLDFNNWEKLENFHDSIIRLQQEIVLSGEIVSPTRLLFKYLKALSNSDKPKYFIAPKMTDLITFPDNSEKSAVYTGGDICVICRYIDIIGAPTAFTTLVQLSHHFSP